MSLSPMMLVGAICLVAAAAVFGYLAAGRLTKMLGGPREGAALIGLGALLLGWAAVVATVMLLSGGKGALNFVLLGLLPGAQAIGLSDRLSTVRRQYGFLFFGAAVCIGLLVVLGWSYLQVRQDVATVGLYGAFSALVVGASLLAARRIHISRRARAS